MEATAVSFWGRLSRSGRIGFIAAASVCVALGVGLAIWALRGDYQVLFAQLAESDAGAIVEQLKRQKVPFELAEGGTTIKVPADRVYETRLSLMSGGVPLSGNIGFEIFDKQGLGATEQSQRVSYQRALQGELARTIAALDNVKQARVHLVLPESTLFKRDQQEPRAAVSITFKPGTSLGREAVGGIQRLVASSVAGLEAAKVVVTDQRGITLSAVDPYGMTSGAEQGRLEIKKAVEESVARKIAMLLDGAFGAGQAIVSVDVALNFDQTKTTVQDVLPIKGSASEGGVVRRKQLLSGAKAEHASSTAADEAAGPRNSNSSSEIEYEYGRRVEEVMSAPGRITRMSVGVIVRGDTNPEKRERIAELVRVAAGINEARGDAIVVQSLDALGMPSSAAVATTAPPDTTETPAAAAATVSDPTSRLGAMPAIAVAGALLAIVAFAVFSLQARGQRNSSKPLSSQQREQLLAEIATSMGQESLPGAVRQRT